MSFRRLGDRCVAAGIAVLTLVYGAFHTGRHAFWLDEAFTAAAAQQPWGRLVDFLGSEAGMGPYYVGLWGWQHLGGSEAWLRTLSVVGGALALSACYLFARRHVARGRVFALALVVALFCNRFFLYNLTELRAYSWAMCLAVVSTLLFVRLRSQPTAANAAWYGASVGLLLGTLVFNIGLVLAHAAFAGPLLRDRTGRRRVALAAAMALVLFAPFVPALLTSDQLNWIPATTPRFVGINVAIALGGYRWAAVLAVGNLALLVTLIKPSLRGSDDTALKVTLAGAVSMPLVLLLLSLSQPLYLARYLSAMTPLAVIGAAAGFARLAHALPATVTVTQRRVGFAVLAVIAVVGLRPAVEFDLARPEDMAGPARLLSKYVSPDDAVVFSNEQMAFASGYYWTPTGTVFLQDVPGRQFDTAAAKRFCHVWYYFRASRAEVLSAIAADESDPDVVVETFAGYTVAEVNRCSA
ncbi:MAG: hypothetical protein Q7V57_11870 [Actinomycetota bacterium]|nr:hypothetical protein [Actinomycetota bacterium]